jgi:sialate O-acetylesterase
MAFAVPLLWCLCAALPAGEAKRIPLQMGRIIGSGMVLQHGMPVPIWGTVTAGVSVTVRFAGQECRATADDTGRWQAVLAPLALVPDHVGRPMTVSAQGQELVLTDVLVGDVWLGSGQSNMETSPEFYRKDLVAAKLPPERGDVELERLIAAGPYPALRIWQAKATNGWAVAGPGTLDRFSSQMFAFGLAMQRTRGIPVGLVVAAVGASPAMAWVNPEQLAIDPVYQGQMKARMDAWMADEAANIRRMEEDHERYRTARKPAPQPTIFVPGTVAMKWQIGDLYRTVVSPIVPFAIKGVLWDQGESGPGVRGPTPRESMAALLHGWRAAWQRPDLPFLVVQKPSGGGCHPAPATVAGRWAAPFVAWPNDRVGSEAIFPASEEDNLDFQGLPGVTIVPVSDLGGGLHPMNKSGYGFRAATVALTAIYGDTAIGQVPRPSSGIREGAAVRVRFSGIGSGLVAAHASRVQGFALSSDGTTYRWAEGVLDGDAVVVRAPGVGQPVAVRYAGAQPYANLFTRDGMPAPGFTLTLPR